MVSKAAAENPDPVVQEALGVQNALFPDPFAADPELDGAVAFVKAMPPAVYEPEFATSPVALYAVVVASFVADA